MWLLPAKRQWMLAAIGIVLAGSMEMAFGETSSFAPWHPLITLNLGVASSATVGQTQNFASNFNLEGFYDYLARQRRQNNLNFGAFLGIERLMPERSILQIGAEYNQALPFYAKGTLTQGADAQSASAYSYQYQVLTRQILLESKLLYMAHADYHPYLLGAVGMACNSVSDYSTSAPSSYVLTRQYQNSLSYSWTYAVGLGFDVDFDERWRVGLGYRFTDLGKASLGQSTIDGVYVAGTLSQRHIYANELMGQLTVMMN
jgi:opacity protein-like surface antigen